MSEIKPKVYDGGKCGADCPYQDADDRPAECGNGEAWCPVYLLGRIAELEADLSRYKAACEAMAIEIVEWRNDDAAYVACKPRRMTTATKVLREHGIEGGEDE